MPDTRPDAGALKPLKDWHEDLGDVLWWTFPIREAPWVGCPLTTTWPGYHTHFTLIPEPPERPDEVLVSRQALLAIANQAEGNFCQHENTKRGGIIWTICEDCGQKWADDQGGFKPYEPPAFVVALRALAESVEC